MTSNLEKKTTSILAPAKINLFLHVTGKKDDGYHLLQSIIAFANFGDEIAITPADDFLFTQESDFKELPNTKDNIIVLAAQKLSKRLNKPLNCHIHLKKNIPIGAGLGGGSANAAAIIKGLLEFWEVFLPAEKLQDLLLSLGADVPVCYYGKTCFVEGIGEEITPIPAISPIPALLIFPNEFCSTQKIFQNYDSDFSEKITLPNDDLFKFLINQKNDLTNAAIKNIPEIKDILGALDNDNNCVLSRMSGSGSACFGIFKTEEETQIAAKKIQKERPNWWVRPILIQ